MPLEVDPGLHEVAERRSHVGLHDVTQLDEDQGVLVPILFEEDPLVVSHLQFPLAPLGAGEGVRQDQNALS